jgi:hypothetical protein
VSDAGVLLGRVLNLATLAVGLVVAVSVPMLVIRDARQRGVSRARALGWGLVALALLPVGLGLYLLLGRPEERDDGEETV